MLPSLLHFIRLILGSRTMLPNSAFDVRAELSESPANYAVNTTLVPWKSDVNVRSSASILLSSATVIFICTWKCLHLNVPPPSDGLKERLARKLLFFTVSVIAPELLAAMAAKDYIAAKAVQNLFGDNGRSISLVHAFFANMGGFHFRIVRGPENGAQRREEQFAVEGRGLNMLVSRGCLSFRHIDDITEDQINDRNKSDFLVYTLALWQIVWMLIQICVRWHYQIPLALVEVNALAFMVYGLSNYGLLWYKPQDVNCAIVLQGDAKVFDKEIANHGVDGADHGLDGYLQDLAKEAGQDGYNRTSIRYGPRIIGETLWVLSLTAAVFNGIHCLAWFYTFPTIWEQWLWRVSSVVATVVGAVAFLFAQAVYKIEKLKWGRYSQLFIAVCLLVYCLARLCLMGLTFSSLRSVPADLYIQPSWINSLFSFR